VLVKPNMARQQIDAEASAAAYRTPPVVARLRPIMLLPELPPVHPRTRWHPSGGFMARLNSTQHALGVTQAISPRKSLRIW